VADSQGRAPTGPGRGWEQERQEEGSPGASARHREEVQDELRVTLPLMEPSPRRRGAWDCLDHAQGQSLLSSTDGSFLGLLDTAGRFRDLLLLPPWGHLAVSVMAVRVQHKVVGNVCCPETPSLLSTAQGTADQPEPDAAHHCLDHSRLCPRGRQPRQSRTPSLQGKRLPTISEGLKESPSTDGIPQRYSCCHQKGSEPHEQPNNSTSHPAQEEWTGSEAVSWPGRHSKSSAHLAGGCQKEKAPP